MLKIPGCTFELYTANSGEFIQYFNQMKICRNRWGVFFWGGGRRSGGIGDWELQLFVGGVLISYLR